MKLKGLTILLTFFVFQLVAQQQITIQVIDAETRQNIEFANVFLERNDIGNISDKDGKVIFDLPKKYYSKDIVQCSFIGYSTIQKNIDLDTISSVIIIALNFSSMEMATVEVNASAATLTGREIIKKAIKNIKNNYQQNTNFKEAFYRESSYENENFIELNEAVVQLQSNRYPQRNYVRHGFRQYYKGDFVSPILPRYEGLIVSTNPQYFKYYVGKKESCRVVEARLSENQSLQRRSIFTGAGPLALMALDKVKYQADFLDKRLLEDYDYKKIKVVIMDNEPCYIIRFYPKSSHKNVHQPWNKKMKFAIYSGNLYVRLSDFTIVKYECQLAEKALIDNYKKQGWQLFPFKNEVEVTYQQAENGKWELAEVSTFQLLKPRKNGKFKGEFQLKRQLIMTKSIEKMDETKSVFEDVSGATIRNFPLNYDADFWKKYEQTNNYPKLKLTELKELEKYKPLAIQFNSWFEYEEKPMPLVIPQKDSFLVDNQWVEDDFLWLENINNTLVQQTIFNENEYCHNQFIPRELERRKVYKTMANIASYCDSELPKKFEVTYSPKGVYGLVENKNEKFYRLLLSYDDDLNEGERLMDFKKSPNDDWLLFQLKTATKPTYFHKEIGTSTIQKITDKSITEVFWLSNDELIFLEDDSLYREYKVWKYSITTAEKTVIFESTDNTKWIELKKVKNGFFINHLSHHENELFFYYKFNNKNDLQTLHKTGTFHSYSFKEEEEQFYILAQKGKEQQAIFTKKITEKDWIKIIESTKSQFIDDFLVTNDFYVLKVIENGKTRLIRCNKNNPTERKNIKLPSDFVSVDWFIQDYETNQIEFYLSSVNIPEQFYELDLNLLKSEPKDLYCLNTELKSKSFSTELLLIPIENNMENLPVRMVYPNADKTNKGVFLKVYGAYGAFVEPTFDEFTHYLLQQGYAVAQVHVRGSRVNGYNWNKAGTLLNKQNGIDDYIAAAKYLKSNSYTNKIIAYGQSAGGTIVGAALNQAAAVFDLAIIDYPFLDVVRTMSNDKLPLTTTEYSEWGNTQQSDFLEYQLNYSPYQNVTKQDYPPTFIIGGRYDFQTPYWQYLKYGFAVRNADTKHPEAHIFLTEPTKHTDSVNPIIRRKQYVYMYLFMKENLNK